MFVHQVPIDSERLTFSLLQLAIPELVSVFMPTDILQVMILVMMAPTLWYEEKKRKIILSSFLK